MCVFRVFVCRFLLCMSFTLPPVYSVSLCWAMWVSAHVAAFQHLFQGNTANHRTFDSGPRCKLLQYVVSSRRHLKPGASRSRQPNISGFVLRDECGEISVTLPLLINKPSLRRLLGLSLSVIWYPSANLFRLNSQFLNTYNFSNRNLRSNCLAVPSHMHIYFEWVNTKFLFCYFSHRWRRASWYHQSPSFTNRCTLYQSYKPLKFTLKLKLKLLLHVSVYDHHQGDYFWAQLKSHL